MSDPTPLQAKELAQAIRDDGCCHHWKEVVTFLDSVAGLPAAALELTGINGMTEEETDATASGMGLVHEAAPSSQRVHSGNGGENAPLAGGSEQ